MGRPKVNKKSRLNLDLNDRSKAQLVKLQKTTNARSMTEVICKAIDLLESVKKVQEKGYKLIVKHEDGTEKEVLIIL